MTIESRLPVAFLSNGYVVTETYAASRKSPGKEHSLLDGIHLLVIDYIKYKFQLNYDSTIAVHSYLRNVSCANDVLEGRAAEKNYYPETIETQKNGRSVNTPGLYKKAEGAVMR